MIKRIFYILCLITLNSFCGFEVTQPDGKKIVLKDIPYGGFILQRYNSDGSPDNKFTSFSYTWPGIKAQAIKFDKRSNIYVYGIMSKLPITVILDPKTADTFIMRFEPSGYLDRTFGNVGMMVNPRY
ncbi:hypothetical protein M1446_03525 [Candidatus Dependentiae bacterium]|nr:hypothetical protein [Candidatus Dependentiae bacterium]